ncbi:hypothetical protein DVH05_027357 [Phytophthora capsici]|nr:hypothetical protein DVH05_027357 [Phytophthora capsici]
MTHPISVQEMVAELKGDVGPRLQKLKSRLTDDVQASVVSSGSRSFRAYAEARSGVGRRMTIASLEDEVMPPPARQHAAGDAAEACAGAVAGIGDGEHQVHAPPQAFCGNVGGYAPVVPDRTTARLTEQDLRVAVEPFMGKGVV